MMSVIITKGGLAGAPDDERHYHEGRAGRVSRIPSPTALVKVRGGGGDGGKGGGGDGCGFGGDGGEKWKMERAIAGGDGEKIMSSVTPGDGVWEQEWQRR